MREDVGRFGLKGKAVLGLFLVVLLLVKTDTFHLTPARATASEHLFSLVRWELSNLPDKWLNLARNLLSGGGAPRAERLESLERYLVLARMVQKEKDRLEGLPFRRGTTLAGGSSKERSAASEDYLNELVGAKEKLRAEAEETIEAELSAVLIDEGLGYFLGIVFPPLDLRFDIPPTVLVTSPRDRVQLREAVLLQPDLPVLERDRLEKQILADHDLSALVDDLAGLATYPSLVSDLDQLRAVLRTAAHEWLHQYLFFRPLGWHYYASPEMSTINETTAVLVGRELGDTAFVRMGGDLSDSARRYLSAEDRDPVFTREMRKTRLGLEELLDEGKVDEAEQYLKERWWFLALRGYRLRKLNQAFFAFRGAYAESPASISPIGGQIDKLRALFPTLGEFIGVMAGVSSHREFLELLKRFGVED